MNKWQDISTAPTDGTRFIGRFSYADASRNWKISYRKRITWHGKASHVPLCGWCYGKVENVDLWHPTHWMPLPARHQGTDSKCKA